MSGFCICIKLAKMSKNSMFHKYSTIHIFEYMSLVIVNICTLEFGKHLCQQFGSLIPESEV